MDQPNTDDRSTAATLFAMTAAAWADGRSVIHHASGDPNVRAMARGLGELGVTVAPGSRGESSRIVGCRGHLPATEASLDITRSQTVSALLLATVAAGHGRYRLYGADDPCRVSDGALADALRDLGCGIAADRADAAPDAADPADAGTDPAELATTIAARGLRGAEIHLASSAAPQHLAALLLVSPLANTDVFLTAPPAAGDYVEIVCDVMRDFGVELLAEPTGRFIVPAPQHYRAREWASPASRNA